MSPSDHWAESRQEMKDQAKMEEDAPSTGLNAPSLPDDPESALLHDGLESDAGSPTCWNLTGSFGDGSCPELAEVIRCLNCPVYSTAGRHLFERKPPEGYIEEWTEQLSMQQDSRGAAKTAVIIFRLGSEWLALPASVFKQVAPMRSIHSLPHRGSPVLLGLTNVLGALRLCISLHDLLGVEKPLDSAKSVFKKSYKRLAVIEKESGCWVFPVDEVYGMHRFHADILQNVPVTVARSAVSYTKGLFPCAEMIVGLLDDELLFYSLKRSIL